MSEYSWQIIRSIMPFLPFRGKGQLELYPKKIFAKKGRVTSWRVSISLLLLVLLLVWLQQRVFGAAAWTVTSARWTPKDEAVYQNFVQALGESRHGNLTRFIRDSKANPLYGKEDKTLRLSPDCADLPYLIRAYVAYKLRLPFSYVSAISSRGGDQRYGRGNKPTSFKDQDYFKSVQHLFNQVVLVNSGYFRMAPNVENADFYPIKIQKTSVVPGTVYYDPNGHVALVYKVTDDGRVRLIDAHPDRSLSRPWFGAKFARGGKSQGGGFKRWRPLWYSASGRVRRQSNRNIPDFSPDDQFQKVFSVGSRKNISYAAYVRAKLSSRGGKIKPLEDFKAMLEDMYEDVRYRAIAVDICIKNKIHLRPHPGALPWNIYGTDGIWEQFSTPSRDARLKVCFLDVFQRTVAMIRMAEQGDPALDYPGSPRQLAGQLLQMYDLMTPQLKISYKNSRGRSVSLNLHNIVQRLFDLSFDPYHPIELRWGASGTERASAPTDKLKDRFYILEHRLRNQLDRLYNCATKLTLGPESHPDVNIRQWLVRYLNGRIPRPVVCALQGMQEKQTILVRRPSAPVQTGRQTLASLERSSLPKKYVPISKQIMNGSLPKALPQKISTEKSRPSQSRTIHFVACILNGADRLASDLISDRQQRTADVVCAANDVLAMPAEFVKEVRPLSDR